MKIKATRVLGCQLKPGDLFSTAGQEYWGHCRENLSIGEKVYIRTEQPASPEEGLEDVYRIEIER